MSLKKVQFFSVFIFDTFVAQSDKVSSITKVNTFYLTKILFIDDLQIQVFWWNSIFFRNVKKSIPD